MEKTILSISGRPGLYLLLTRGRSTLIVESLDAQKKRQNVGLRDKVTSLGDISIYTDDEDTPLMHVFKNIFDLYKGETVDIDTKKADKKVLYDFMAKALPNFDRDRVYPGDIKKMINWYNILVREGYTDFETPSDEPEAGESESPEKEA